MNTTIYATRARWEQVQTNQWNEKHPLGYAFEDSYKDWLFAFLYCNRAAI